MFAHIKTEKAHDSHTILVFKHVAKNVAACYGVCGAISILHRKTNFWCPPLHLKIYVLPHKPFIHIDSYSYLSTY